MPALALTLALVLACALCCGCSAVNAPSEVVSDMRTVFVYLCGSSLETKQGIASKNLSEMLDAGVPDNVRVIVETGGAAKWRGHDIASDHLQRYELLGNEMTLLEDLNDASMGEATTFYDFIDWGVGNYWGERNALVLWGYGGTSGGAVCHDETWDDWLDRSDVEASLDVAEFPAKLDLVALDVCFGANMENAAALSPYADYLVASQEVVPAKGLDYGQLVRDFATKDGEELGRSICEAYLAKCAEADKADIVQTSLFDLTQASEVIRAIDRYFGGLEALREADPRLTEYLASASHASAIYAERGTANLLDLGSLTELTATFDGADPDALREALGSLVAYSAAGSAKGSTGVSLYYPFDYDGKRLERYCGSCPAKGYASLLGGMFAQAGTGDNDLVEAGGVDGEGRFRMRLPEGAHAWVESVTLEVDRPDTRHPGEYVPLGQTTDVVRSADGTTYTSGFDGTWPGVGGDALCILPYLTLPHQVTYTAPVRANGKLCELLVTYDDAYATCSLWEGRDAWGMPLGGNRDLRSGDMLAACMVDEYGTEDYEQLGATVTVGDVSEVVDRVALPDGDYRCRFVVTGLDGHTLTSDYASCRVAGGKLRTTEIVGE